MKTKIFRKIIEFFSKQSFFARSTRQGPPPPTTTGSAASGSLKEEEKKKSWRLYLFSWYFHFLLRILYVFVLFISLYLTSVHKQPFEVFFKIDVLKYFAVLAEKHLRSGLFLIKFQTFRSASFLRRDCSTGVFLWILRDFSEQLFFWTPLLDGCTCT